MFSKIMKKRDKEKDLNFFCTYFLSVGEIIYTMSEMFDTWNTTAGELSYEPTREKYSLFMKRVVEALREDTDIGAAVHYSLKNISLLFEEISKRYSDLKVETITNSYIKEWYGKVLEVVDNIAVGGWQMNDGEICYETITGWINDVCNSTLQDNEYDMYALEKYITDEPFETKYSTFDLLGKEFSCFVSLFEKQLQKIIEKAEEDKYFVEDVQILCKQYDIIRGDIFEEMFLRKVDDNVPHILVEYENGMGKTVSRIGGIYLDSTPSDTIVVFKFNNIPIEQYSVKYRIVENEGINMDSFDSVEYVKYIWKDLGKDMLGLEVIPNHNLVGGCFKMRLYIEGREDISAYIRI